ncbi:nicotinate phosphoribosyltransferase [Tundrisphaera sp. TA3]|uniref:nicotinate phosphoribosyltransferase n=1 Tax=Tundrisphaera sp. TA3 TaxID=3435775 RepID=UPI003EB9985D
MNREPSGSPWPDPAALGTLTDLYQLTMMAGYAAEGIAGRRATFEMFVRKLPHDRSYLVMAGLEQAVEAVRTLRFSEEQVQAIRAWPEFAGIDRSWFDALREFRFRGDLWAIPEGAIVFANEPLLRVEATLAEAQLIETLVLSMMGYPTLIASKASRIVEAARGRPVVDFGARRGHGPQAALLNARASYLAGFAGTSHVEAALRLGIPAFGTMAHSWVQAFDDEPGAFAAYARHFPDATTLLVDTYDIPQGVRNAADIEPPIRAIRIDSGDLLAETRRAREILDERGRRDVQILVSNDLDEFKIADLVNAGAPIDAFGVGTELITSRDAPAISMVYKLVELGGAGRIKKASGKKTYPLGKQVIRSRDGQGRFAGDHVIAATEPAEVGSLLEPILRGGELVRPWPSLQAIRDRARAEREGLPDSLRALEGSGSYPITYSDLLEAEAARLGLA